MHTRSRALELAQDARLVGVPKKVPQATFPEAKTAAQALADGPSLWRWMPADGELALRHKVPGWPLQTKVEGGPLLEWLALPADGASLREEIQSAGLPAILAWHICIGLALEHGHVRITLDDLIASIGWDPRSRVEKEAQRYRFWRWLALFDSMKVIGQRPGKFRDKRSGKLLSTVSVDALLKITGRRLPASRRLDECVPPIEVSFVAGPWLEQHRGNHQVLTYFGGVRRLAAISAGRPSGIWAQAIGFALQQYWREHAATAEVAWVGEGPARHRTVRFHPLCTRQSLLDQFSPIPSVHSILESDNPGRAQTYWDDAIEKLRGQHVIGHCKPVGSLTAGRKGWEQEWLTQELDIRPHRDHIGDIIEIAERRSATRRSRGKRSSERQPAMS